MEFLRLFLRLFLCRPVQATVALYFRMTGRRVRALNRLRRAAQSTPGAYQFWIEDVEPRHAAAHPLPDPDELGAGRPSFTFLIDATSDVSADELRRTLDSLRAQDHASWDMLVFADVERPDLASMDDARLAVVGMTAEGAGAALTDALHTATGQYVVPLQAGAIIAPTALLRYEQAILADARPGLLYADNDWIGADGRRCTPWLKPEWNSELALAQDYFTCACAIDRERAIAAGQILASGYRLAIYELFLRVASDDDCAVVHVSHILCHAPARLPWCDEAEGRSAVVQALLASSGAVVRGGAFGTVKVSWPLPVVPPLVSIIVPTRDKVDLLETCIFSILDLTSYNRYEIIVADNESRDPETLSYFRKIIENEKVSIVRYDGKFNYSAINNFAASAARGEYICLLNNDTEVVSRTWLEEMMRQAVRPSTGAVGAKLLYGDDTIQHAGVVVGMGQAAGHAHRGQRNDDPGYFCQTHVQRFATAVTAACLLVEKRKFDAVGGLDEAGLKVAYNDVDLCLKLQEAGWHNVFVPDAVLYHHESKSRGSDFSPEHAARYAHELGILQTRWGTRDYVDPLHHVLLDPSSERYALRFF